ncbi:hypothetical protein B1B04_17145 [Lysinibacillus sp. KCTC 33748]|nr:hypothetical protein B1B04_17145 [Lysinibacillus sp. KCTC 33748]
MLRWNIDRNTAVIPKSANRERLKSNLDIFDFTFSAEEMNKIANLDQNKRGFVNPNNNFFLWITQFLR